MSPRLEIIEQPGPVNGLFPGFEQADGVPEVDVQVLLMPDAQQSREATLDAIMVVSCGDAGE